MSRETDSSSSGPQGRGGSSYPPGTEPYGPGAPGPAGEAADADEAAAAGADPGPGASRPYERKTETTLTTRIRINIPGSRPIPPVVMRTPVSDSESGGPAGPAAGGVLDTGGPAGEPIGGAAGGAQPPGAWMAGDDTRSGAAPGPDGPGGAGGGYGAGDTGGGRPSEEASGTGEFRQQTSDWFAPRKGKPAPGGTGGGAGGAAAGPGEAARAYGTDPYGSTDPYGAAGPYGSGDPYDTGAHPQVGYDTPAEGFFTLGGPGGFPGAPRSGLDGLADGVDTGASSAGEPGGPTTGPATGDTPLPPRPGAGSASPEPPASSTLGLGTGRAPFAPGGIGEDMFPESSGPAGGPGGPGRTGGPGGPGRTGGPGGSGGVSGTGGNSIAGGTVVSGIPRVPEGKGASSSPFQSSLRPRGSSASGRRTPSRTADVPSGGRSKLVLVGVGLVGILGIAYGAGLLLDHADVPNGTTVLGNDIGGTSKHEAVNKLDEAFGNSTTKPFTIVAGGKQTQLKPSVAGLTLDTEATVRAAAGRDYNPVSVIGSLFGAERPAEPAVKVDKAKMASAVAHVSQETGDGGSPKDGMVKFIRGKAVGIPGKTHKGIDTGDASAALQKAYRTRAATGKNRPVQLPVSMQQPKVGKQEIKRAIRQFGKPAMSGLVTVKAGSASIQFSPQKSLPKFLSMKPVNGTLVDTYNLAALQKLYGTTFAGVKISRGDGSKTPVMPQDVAGALRLALKETTPAKRVAKIPTNQQ